jgi:FixJ family two-component response regulator
VPVLVISGFAEGEATQELLAAGGTLFLEKPFRPSAFRERVNRILGNS